MKKLWQRVTRKSYEQGVIDAFKYVSECLDAVDRHEPDTMETDTVKSSVVNDLRRAMIRRLDTL
jgi:hypothetical protein